MLIDTFLDYLQFEKNYSIKTIISYRVDLFQFERYIKDFNEEITFREVDIDITRKWIINLLEKGYTATSVDRKLSSLKSFYKFLLIRKEISKNPIKNVIGPKAKKRIPIFLKENEINKILDETTFEKGFVGIRDRTIIETFYATGIRLSELIALNDNDIDFDNLTIKVTGKRNKQRLIPFDIELDKSFKKYISKRNQETQKDSEAFFIKEDGKRVYSGLVYKLVRRQLAKVVTLKKRSPHVLRHTFATAMLNNEASLNVIKELLGHSSLSATEVYTHTTFEELKKIYKQAHPRA